MSAIAKHTRPRNRQLRFGLHYLEMVVVMFAGMGILGLLQSPVFSFGELLRNDPAAGLAVMSANMTLPMVAWMRIRGHRWGPTVEMAASMVVPTLIAGVLLAGGVVTDGHALMGIQHTLMFPAMLGVMLARRDEYSH